MAKIDFEKFVTSLLCGDPQCNWTIGTVDIRNALKEQGLEYKDGKIVEINGDWWNGTTPCERDVKHHKLQASEQQQEHISFMLGDDSDLLCTYNDCIKIDGYITYDDMAKITDYLRKEEKL